MPPGQCPERRAAEPRRRCRAGAMLQNAMPSGRIQLERNRFAKSTNARIIMTHPIRTGDLGVYSGGCGLRKQPSQIGTKELRQIAHCCTHLGAPRDTRTCSLPVAVLERKGRQAAKQIRPRLARTGQMAPWSLPGQAKLAPGARLTGGRPQSGQDLRSFSFRNPRRRLSGCPLMGVRSDPSAAG